MTEGLKPCPHRRVDDNGRILCGWIKNGDNQVSADLCRACPVSQIDCQHLRAALGKTAPSPITVRYATGRVEVWNDEAPSIDFTQAACRAKTIPIQSVKDCSGCPLRMPNIVPQSAIQVARPARLAVPIQNFSSAATPTVAGQSSAAPAKRQSAAEARGGRQPSARAEAQLQEAATSAHAVTTPPPPSAQRGIDSGAAQQLIERAKRMAAQKEQVRTGAEPRQAATPSTASQLATGPVQPTPTAYKPEAGGIDGNAAQELIARAKKLAAGKEEERRAVAERRVADPPPSAPANSTAEKRPRSKIILLQQWLAEQMARKSVPEPSVPEPDEDGVQDIVYAPIAPTYAEESGLERCVGWTD